MVAPTCPPERGSRWRGSRCRIRPLLLLLAALAPALIVRPLAAAGLELAGLRQPALVCLESASLQGCRAVLEQSHSLKTLAEQRKLWRCYTSLLAVEALLIAATQQPSTAEAQPLNRGFQEAERACGSRQGPDLVLQAP